MGRRIGIALAAALASLWWAASQAGAADGASEFARGLAAFEQERWADARDAFSRALEADPGNGSAHLLLGLCALGLEDPEEAVAEFRVARRLDPRVEPASLYHEGVAHALAGRLSDARGCFERARELDPDSSLAARAQARLEGLERSAQALRRFRLSGSAGVEYQSDVTVPELDESSGRADGAAVADVSMSYRAFEGEGGTLEGGYDFSQSLYFRVSGADQQAHAFWLDGARPLGKAEGGLGYRFTTTTLGGDAFLNLQQLRPRVLLPLRSWWSAELSAGYLHKDFSEESERDASRVSLGVENFFSLPDRRPRLRAGVAFEGEDARGAEYDYLGFVLGGGVRVPFTLAGEWGFDASWRLKLRDYTHDTPSLGKPRRDWDQAVVVGLVRKLGRRIELRTDYRLTDATSNLPSADYVDHSVGMRVRASL